MTFKNNSHNNQQLTNQKSGVLTTIANYLPMVSLLFEQMTGNSIPQAKGTLADILSCLQRLETKLDNLERNCETQFNHQESQLNSLQKISKLVSSKETKAIHFSEEE